ncbi:MAG: hypothetical protein KGI08_04935 [Thaumarchaeota archaeon]|nr:hypothetical protein [Nitrososphaerota archaeon]MDE1867040.1 hypothetical protein [Nitrososphaerota archaeon]
MSEQATKPGAVIPDRIKQDVNYCPFCGTEIDNCKTETWDKCPYDDCAKPFKVSSK